MTELTAFCQTHLGKVEEEMLAFVKENTNDQLLEESMCYSIKAGGKRIRPQLMLVSAASFKAGMTRGIYQTAAALELIHTYSLIHDDLPAMDDDTLRRGKPTNHTVYGAGIATLAGDGLLTLAFDLLSRAELSMHQRLALISRLAKAAGTKGMVAGQAADIQGEGKKLSLEELKAVHRRKTGQLIEFALVAGGILASQPEEVLEILHLLAQHLGLAFQIRDDLLDVLSTAEAMGKNVGRDAEMEKNTYPALLGLDGAKEALKEELSWARDYTAQLEKEADIFTETLLLAMIDVFALPD